ELVVDLVSDGVAASVAPTVRETVDAVQSIIGDDADRKVMVSELTGPLRLDISAVSRRVQAAVTAGYLVNHEDRKGRPAQLTIGEPMPDDLTILPEPERLHGCTVAG